MLPHWSLHTPIKKIPQHIIKHCELPTSQAIPSHPREIRRRSRAPLYFGQCTLSDLPSLEWERWEHKQWLVFSSCKLLFQKHSANASKNCWWKNILVTARMVLATNDIYPKAKSLQLLFSLIFLMISATWNFFLKRPNCHTITILILNMTLLWCSKAPNTLHKTVLVLSGS